MKNFRLFFSVILITSMVFLFLTPVMAESSVYYKAYVPSSDNDVIDIVNLTTSEIEDSLVGAFPVTGAINPNGNQVFIVYHEASKVDVIDPSTNELIGSISVNGYPAGISFTPDGSKAYITLWYTASAQSDIYVVDTASLTVIETIDTPYYHLTAITYANGSFYALSEFGYIYAIDATDHTITSIETSGTPFGGIAANSSGTKVYAVGRSTDNLFVVDTAANTLASVDLEHASQSVEISKDGSVLYVADYNSPQITIVDTSDHTYTIRPVSFGSDTYLGITAIGITPDGEKMMIVARTSGASKLLTLNLSDFSVTNALTLSGVSSYIFGQFMLPISVSSNIEIEPSPEKTMRTKSKMEPVTLSPANGHMVQTDDLAYLVAIPEQWMETTGKVEFWLESSVVDAKAEGFSYIEMAKSNLKSVGTNLLASHHINLMQRVTNKDGIAIEGIVSQEAIRSNFTIRLPIPADLLGTKDLGMVYMEDTGSIAYLATRIVEIDNVRYLEFENNRSAVYGIISDKNHAAVQ